MIGKQFLPKTLFGRALLILLLPTVLIQMVTAYAFFDRHWANITRYMAGSLAGEIGLLVSQLESLPGEHRGKLIRDFAASTAIGVMPDAPESFRPADGTEEFPEFQEQLRRQVAAPFTLRRIEGGDVIEVRLLLPDGALRLTTTVKRLESRTTVILMLWTIGASVIFLLIASLFLRNQVRPIRRLAWAADNFGRGVDTPDYRPSGAAEVRMAARAFITMRERIRRQLRTRTEMLAGISHDLRTPLTRMKLELAMLKNEEAAKELRGDVQQMELMIQEYLDFARGADGEETTPVSLKRALEEVIEDYRRLGADVALEAPQDVTAELRVTAFTRMMHNLMDNALRYGSECRVTLKSTAAACEIVIDDNGPGIPEESREEVFQPFRRLEASRNVKTGGVGLGLTIARDIALSHGGGISLATSPQGGLRIVIRLPLHKENL